MGKKLKWPKKVKVWKSMYGTPVFFFHELEKLHQAMDYLQEGSSRHYPEQGMGVVIPYERDGRSKLILMGVFNKEPATLAHECVHAAYFVLDHAGIKHDVDNHEVLAYMVSDMMERFK